MRHTPKFTWPKKYIKENNQKSSAIHRKIREDKSDTFVLLVCFFTRNIVVAAIPEKMVAHMAHKKPPRFTIFKPETL